VTEPKVGNFIQYNDQCWGHYLAVIVKLNEKDKKCPKATLTWFPKGFNVFRETKAYGITRGDTATNHYVKPEDALGKLYDRSEDMLGYANNVKGAEGIIRARKAHGINYIINMIDEGMNPAKAIQLEMPPAQSGVFVLQGRFEKFGLSGRYQGIVTNEFGLPDSVVASRMTKIHTGKFHNIEDKIDGEKKIGYKAWGAQINTESWIGGKQDVKLPGSWQ